MKLLVRNRVALVCALLCALGVGFNLHTILLGKNAWFALVVSALCVVFNATRAFEVKRAP